MKKLRKEHQENPAENSKGSLEGKQGQPMVAITTPKKDGASGTSRQRPGRNRHHNNIETGDELGFPADTVTKQGSEYCRKEQCHAGD